MTGDVRGVNGWSLSSLRIRLLFLVLSAVLPAFALLLHTAFEQRRAVAVEIQETALRLARLAASDHGRWIAGTRELLVGLALLPSVQNGGGRACNAAFADVLRRYPIYANLGVADADGRLSCSAVPLDYQVSIADRLYFRRAMATGGFAFGEYQVGRVTGKATLNVGYPVRDAAGIRGVVFAAIDLAWLNRFLVEAHLPQGSVLTVVDESGRILVHHPEPDRWVGQSMRTASLFGSIVAMRLGVAEAEGVDRVPRLFGFTPLMGSAEAGNVFLSIGIPMSSAMAEANRSLLRNLGILALVTVLVLMVGWVASKAFVFRQVDTLVAATSRIGAGDFTARTGAGGGDGELEHLGRAFDQMAAALERDVAERERTWRELEAQREALYKNEKLAGLGRLAAGVAHELRNPLSVITARVGLLERRIAQGNALTPDLLERDVASLGEAAERMTRIMESLGSYARPAKREPTLLDVGELLGATRELVADGAKASATTVQLEVPAALPPVLGDRSKMMEVFLNLGTNAVEAMDGQGGQVTFRARPADGAVVVEVADTGPGIPDEILEKVWEPFYTTKPEGTGLGLSIVRSLLEEQGATIAVTSEVGRGTTFRVTIPAAPTEPA